MNEREELIVRGAAARIDELLQGGVPAAITEAPNDGPLSSLAARVNRLIGFVTEIRGFVEPLARGELGTAPPPTGNFLSSPFKELHSRLRHLTWQAQQVARGDYSHRVDFMGDFSEAFNAMVAALDQKEKLLTQKIEQLEHTNRIKNEFLGMAAHDLRNPISVISIYAAFLLENKSLSLPEKEREMIVIIQRQSTFILRLLNDLLDVSVIESGRLNIDMTTNNYITFLKYNIRLNRVLAARKDIRLRLEAPATRLALGFDRQKMDQVLNNLISNAVKFSPPGSLVTIRARKDGPFVVTSIIDRGPGIPPEELETIFKEFHKGRAKPTAGEKSTGLGLAITRRIIEGHGGSISVESTPGKGASFTFTLPA
jgi:signal transduction histidine kinase